MSSVFSNYRPTDYPSLPWYFRLARNRIAEEKKGGYFLIRLARRMDLLNRYAWFPFGDGTRFLAPLNFPYIEKPDLSKWYEPDAIKLFCKAICSFPKPAILIDCGADIGVFSRLVWRETQNIRKIIAFEPNPESFYVLQCNLSELPTEVVTLQEGLGEKDGRADLVSPVGVPDNHAKFLQSSSCGEVRVRNLDGLDIPVGQHVAVKLDVEGAELATLKGATHLLSNAEGFVVQFEAHHRITNETGIDPIECARLISELRRCAFFVCDENRRGSVQPLSLDKPFFEQFSDTAQQVLDVIVCTA